MKRLLATTLGAVVLALAAGFVLAESAATPPAAGEGTRGERLAERLGLTAEQQEQMRTLLKAAHEQAENATDREAKAKIMREAMEKVKATVLNDEQRKKWDGVRESVVDRARERGGEMFDRAGLTLEQKESAKAIMQAARTQAESATDREAKAKIFREAVEKVKATVLTDEQRKKLQADREGRGPDGPGGPGTGGETVADRVKDHLARLTERLSLTPAQQEAAREILKAAHEQAQGATDPEAKAKALREATEKIRATVLTDEQRKKMENAREELKEHRRGSGAGGEGLRGGRAAKS
jgi:Spy/CpxP family protein refolding chaperone